MSRAYYNEIEPYAAQWIRNLIAAGLVTPGEVDTRSIVDVRPSDLDGFARCHFFAGIAVWDYALGLAGWPASRAVWTGSCPCQPFSAAGRGGGVSDERHLWPHWHHLIRECRPGVVLGEQVASKDGLGWLDLVHADLEGEGYAVGAVDLCAAGVGAPHIRQRLWFVAESTEQGPQRRFAAGQRSHTQLAPAERGGAARILANTAGKQQPRALQEQSGEPGAGGKRVPAGGCRDAGIMGDAALLKHAQHRSGCVRGEETADATRFDRNHGVASAGAACFWSDADWIPCRDGKARPVEPGTFPLAHGATSRVGRLRAYGNAINAQVAAAFIGACLEVRP